MFKGNTLMGKAVKYAERKSTLFSAHWQSFSAIHNYSKKKYLIFYILLSSGQEKKCIISKPLVIIKNLYSL